MNQPPQVIITPGQLWQNGRTARIVEVVQLSEGYQYVDVRDVKTQRPSRIARSSFHLKRCKTGYHLYEELVHTAERMRLVTEQIYWLIMRMNVHTFTEFNGLLSKWVEICYRLAKQGIDFTAFNEHSGTVMPVEEHDMKYLAEKLRCIFGPIIDASDETKRTFATTLLGEGWAVQSPEDRRREHEHLQRVADKA